MAGYFTNANLSPLWELGRVMQKRRRWGFKDHDYSTKMIALALFLLLGFTPLNMWATFDQRNHFALPYLQLPVQITWLFSNILLLAFYICKGKSKPCTS